MTRVMRLRRRVLQ